MEKMSRVDPEHLEGEELGIRYVKVTEVLRWPENPKKHDIGGIIGSIAKHGFRDPSAYDATLGGLVEGNGRAEALALMQRDKQYKDKPPRGIMTDGAGNWYMPILFGVDSVSQIAAKQYAIDHNQLVLSGGDFTVFDMARLWDGEGYKSVMQGLKMAGEETFTMDLADIGMLLSATNEATAPQQNGEEGERGNDRFDVGQVMIRFNAMDYEDEVREAVRELISENPHWDAKLIGE